LYSVLSWLLRILPLAPQRKAFLKSAVYRHVGRFMVGSQNHEIWLRQQAVLRHVPLAPDPIEPSESNWNELRSRRAAHGRPTSLTGSPYILVPIHRGRSETLACLYSVLSADASSEIIAINDCSPDQILVARLRQLAADGLIQLKENEHNLGFALTVNLGMALYPDRDVVLLNSDTEVYGDWLERLNRLVHSHPKIGTATPLSNNAEICSYPHWLQDNPMQLESGYEAIDRLASHVNEGAFVEAPTAVGFCMYIRRSCLTEVGPFDERFAAGYGEENDFCLRATAEGWTHVIAGNVFVRHVGAVSFGNKTRRRRARALRLIQQRFPEYGTLIQAYVQRDPVERIRRRLDTARLIEADGALRQPKKAMLFVVHGWGGGIAHHVTEMEQALRTEGVRVYILRPDSNAGANLESRISQRFEIFNTPSLDSMPLRGDTSSLVGTLKQLEISHIHVHHVGGFRDLPIDDLRRLARRLGCRYDVTLHDFAPICPRLHLTDGNGRYCGEPAIDGCERCVSEHGTPFGMVSVRDWREDWREGLREARRVFCPTEDTLSRIRRHFPDGNYVIRPHVESLPDPVNRAPRREPREALRVGIPGAIGHQKGFDLILACARDARARRLPLSFQVIGYTADDRAARAAGLEVSGRFEPKDADAALSASGCHLAFIPSLSPETFSFMLSSAFRTRLYPVVFDLGGLAERVREARWGEILPTTMMTEPASINDRLLELTISLPPLGLDTGGHRYASLTEDYYERFSEK
jgi:GT2 family glycosyltransferase/glycosyltransferase involved in cell wall biosynthesis